MNIVQLDHINIAAPASLLQQVKQFYIDHLGFAEGPRPEFSSPGYWLYANELPLIHLSEKNRSGSGNSHLDHIAFRGLGLMALVRRLEQAGIEYRRNYIAELDMSQVFFHDPAGTGLEVNFTGEC